MATRRIGLIVNPIAGMGGSVGLKGTDGANVLSEARRRGAEPACGLRVVRALTEMVSLRDNFTVLTVGGAMGGEAAQAAGLVPELVTDASVQSSAIDTRAAVHKLMELGAELILFGGGDGTARDIHAVVGLAVPMLGIPSGVKMQSGVFATSPSAAGRLAALSLDARAGHGLRLKEVEIMDIDEDIAGSGRISARLYGYARAPFERLLLQQAKTGAVPGDDAEVASAAHGIAREMKAGVFHVIGPGHSAKQVLNALGLQGALLGIDLVKDGRLAGSDLSAGQLSSLCASGPVRIVVGVTGGQGFVFGRGNQQIATDVIGKAGREGLVIIAGRRKLATFTDARLLVDTGDAALDAALAGHFRVRCGADQWAVMRLAPA